MNYTFKALTDRIKEDLKKPTAFNLKSGVQKQALAGVKIKKTDRHR